MAPSPHQAIKDEFTSLWINGSVRIVFDSDVEGMPEREADWLARKALAALRESGYLIMHQVKRGDPTDDLDI